MYAHRNITVILSGRYMKKAGLQIRKQHTNAFKDKFNFYGFCIHVQIFSVQFAGRDTALAF